MWLTRSACAQPRLSAPAAATTLTTTNITMSASGSWMAPPSAAPAESVSWEMLVTVVITCARAAGGAYRWRSAMVPE